MHERPPADDCLHWLHFDQEIPGLEAARCHQAIASLQGSHEEPRDALVPAGGPQAFAG